MRDTSDGRVTAANAQAYETGVFQTLYLVEQVQPTKVTVSLEIDFKGETRTLHVEVVDGVFTVLSVWDSGVLLQNLLANEYEPPSQYGDKATKGAIGTTEIEAIKRKVATMLVGTFPGTTI